MLSWAVKSLREVLVTRKGTESAIVITYSAYYSFDKADAVMHAILSGICEPGLNVNFTL